jgi:hypothetical protein
VATTLFAVLANAPPTTTWTTGLRTLSFSRSTGLVASANNNTVASLVTAANPQGAGNVDPVSKSAATALAAAGTVESGATIGTVVAFRSDPILAVTIAGSITVNFRASESAAQANYGMGCKLYRVDSTGAIVAAFAQGSSTVELGTAEAAVSFTLTPTSTAFSAGDSILVLPFYVAAGGTSASGRSATFVYNGPTPGASGDAFLTFTETIAAYVPLRPRQRVIGQAVQRAASRCWARRPSGIVVPRLWTPEEA